MYIGHDKSLSCSELRGSHFPLMNLHERSLSVLACRYVDEVIIGAPWEVSNDMVCYYLLLYALLGRAKFYLHLFCAFVQLTNIMCFTALPNASLVAVIFCLFPSCDYVSILLRKFKENETIIAMIFRTTPLRYGT